jgi:hypothetical protein
MECCSFPVAAGCVPESLDRVLKVVAAATNFPESEPLLYKKWDWSPDSKYRMFGGYSMKKNREPCFMVKIV